jgi:ectoine hydroxylase-related dioxygenase (phytanoyl-CoA dioxygenase family)
MGFSLSNEGFQIISSVLTETEIVRLRKTFQVLSVAPGHRNLNRLVPEVAELALSPKVLGMLEALLETRVFPVRSIYFDKTPEANWLVPWHQDLSIAVKERLDLPAYSPWSVKDGVPHVQPPVEILENMVTVRLHLDDCNESNGALRVIPGSHRHGRLSSAEIAEMRSKTSEVTCSVLAGDAVLMRPLLLHASSEATSPHHRRVIHLEYATRPLAEGLEWAETIKP